MLSLRGRSDFFRLLLPKEFLYKDVEIKYAEILKAKKGIFIRPIDYLNESIQRVQVLGFNDAVFLQQQPRMGTVPTINKDRVEQNQFLYPDTEEAYRSPMSPVGLSDKTLNIEFRQELGYLNYAKPDVHLIEICYETGLCDNKNEIKVFETIVKIADECNITPYKLDKIFWLICSGNFYIDKVIIKGHKKDFIEYLKKEI